jgi:MYXO-CTERM domain-containing protein
MRHFLFASLAVSLLVPVSAGADAIGPPPDRCPEGSAAEFCHGPPTCRVSECMSNTDCMPGQECQPRRICVEDHACGGRLMTPIYPHAFGPCMGDRCAEGTCRDFRACVPAGSTPPDAGPRDGGSNVDAGGSRDSGTPGVDSGTPGVDSGTPGVDSGTPARDSGTPPARDAGSGGGGGGGSDDGGCGCHVPGSSRSALYGGAFVAGLLAITVAFRRRRRR